MHHFGAEIGGKKEVEWERDLATVSEGFRVAMTTRQQSDEYTIVYYQGYNSCFQYSLFSIQSWF